MSKERNIFEIATRNRFRFPFRGLISVEDLWQISVGDLDSIFKTLNSELKQVKEESLLKAKTQQDTELDTKIEIVKYIVEVKLTEERLKADGRNKREQLQKIYGLIDSKKYEALQNKSVEELLKMAEELDN